MSRVVCLFCNTETDALQSAGYCDGCGRKLPTSAMVHTKRSLARAAEETADGPRHVGGLAETLLAAAVVHLVGGGLFLVVGPATLPEVRKDFLPRVMTWTLIPTAFVGALVPLARRSPRGAAGAALAGALAWVGVTFALDAEFALRWLLVQGLLLAVLAYAARLAFRNG